MTTAELEKETLEEEKQGTIFSTEMFNHIYNQLIEVKSELRELMQKINEYNKGGKMTITLEIGIAEKNELNIQAEVKTQKPKGKKPANPFYRDSKGELYVDDPNQMHLGDIPPALLEEIV